MATSLAIAGVFNTSLGNAYPFKISAITTDSGGNTYVVGSRPLAAGSVAVVNSSTSLEAGSDVFLTKLDPNGKVLFTDTFGGKGNDIGAAITLDSSGNIYIAGNTTSPDFPLSKALQTQIYPGGLPTGFIMKLSNDGTAIFYSTYFGGTLGQSSISALATDAKGNLYVTGSTNASDFPQTSGLPIYKLSAGAVGAAGAIVAEISAAGDKIIYSGVLGGNSPECPVANCSPKLTSGAGIGIDAAGSVYIGGNTNTTDLATTAGVLVMKGLGAFVAKVNGNGAGLAYLTYLGSGLTTNFGPPNLLTGITIDAAGNVYFAGWSIGGFLTTPGSYDPVAADPGSFEKDAQYAVVGKLNTSGSAMVWATYVGGLNSGTQSIAIDGNGNVWATGTTDSPFPDENGWITGPEFLVGLNAMGSALTYSALYPADTVAQSVALDPSGLVHVAGLNGFISTIAPGTAPAMSIFAFQNVFGGDPTPRISPAEVVAIYGPGIGPATAVTAVPVNSVYPATLGGVQVTVNGANMPLLYVSANQINAVLPMELPGRRRRSCPRHQWGNYQSGFSGLDRRVGSPGLSRGIE